jgi:hypothetical protein
MGHLHFTIGAITCDNNGTDFFHNEKSETNPKFKFYEITKYPFSLDRRGWGVRVNGINLPLPIIPSRQGRGYFELFQFR